ncbi:MAG TPA: DNA translocase FtsK 4TM domain-containing protein [Patescibacteria group bacterium]|jgi:S-DNA-T family DNA segregation ATPase FtsK/SpoIIIE|nr:DNA translocase FtsK 4TM domain-containing protein [Patescibacteria group bacterium]
MGRNKKRSNKDRDESGSLLKSIPKPHLDLASETKRGIAVVVFLILAGITALSVVGAAGGLGQFIFKMFQLLAGVLAYLLPLLFALTAYLLFKSTPDEENKHPYFRTYLGIFLAVGAVAGLIHSIYITSETGAVAIANAGRAGGWLGALFAGPIVGAFGFWAGDLLLIGILVIGVGVTVNISPTMLFRKKAAEEAPVPGVQEKIKINALENMEAAEAADDEEEEEPAPKMAPAINLTPSGPSKDDEAISKMESIILEDRRDWKLPPFDLLDDNKTEVDSGNIENNVTIIQKALADFGIEVEMGEVNVGPTVTQYTLRPAVGVKLSQIASLQNDLALALSAHAIRMELPIPGKALVGIEVPNKSTAIVRLREVMQTSDFVNSKGKLSLALGRDVAGRPMVVDLAKMPHMLIAGATGTGKSVAINSLFISLLYKNTPQDVKFIVVDPKRVELNMYNGIPHLLTPAITESDKAVNALKWAVAEMERRYKLLAEAGNRNIADYNAATELHLPYIVIIVDELADLMAVAQNEVEAAIVRLAQMARAVGIHLILATQRPSVEVITGLIKANITSRAAFAVASQVDSRTILDSSGAEKLLGNGDMLFVSAEFNKPRRVQGAFIGEQEVRKVVDFFKNQAGAVIYNEDVIEKPKRGLGLPGMGGGGDEDDELFEAAKEEVIRAGKASASLLQRRLRVGYARAARLLDILEERNIIGPGDGAKPREVYAISEDEKSEYGSEEVEQ